MRYRLSLISLVFLVSLATALNLNVTAVTANDGKSVFECWKLDKPFVDSTQPGLESTARLDLGGVSNISYGVLPAGYIEPLHNAPSPQWVVLLSGAISITLPGENSTMAYVSGGEFGLIFADDTKETSRNGHGGHVLGNTEAIALQIPTVDGHVPVHTVMHCGPCHPDEATGLEGHLKHN